VGISKKIMAGVNHGRTSNQSKTLFHWLTKGNSLKNSSTYGFGTSQVGAGSGSEDCIVGGDGQGGGCDSGHDGSDIGSNYIGGCSGVGVGGETGSGEDGSGDWVMNTSDSGAKGGGRGIAHTRGTGNSGYSGGESGASVAPAAAVDHFTLKTDLNPVMLWLLRPLALMRVPLHLPPLLEQMTTAAVGVISRSLLTCCLRRSWKCGRKN